MMRVSGPDRARSNSWSARAFSACRCAPVGWTAIAFTVIAGTAIVLMSSALPALAGAPDGGAPDKKPVVAFEDKVEAMLRANGLRPNTTSLMVYSTRKKRTLFRLNETRPRPAASNIKLLISFAALKVLKPKYRWRTRFILTEENDDEDGPNRQGLLVEASGDPSMTRADLEKIALRLRSRGLRRLRNGIYLKGRLLDYPPKPPGRDAPDSIHPWNAPFSPFIVSGNRIRFILTPARISDGFTVMTAVPGIHAVSTIRASWKGRFRIRVKQSWREHRGRFIFSGLLRPSIPPYRISISVDRPRIFYYQMLKAALLTAGIQPPIPLRDNSEPPPGRKLLHTRLSPPLRNLLPLLTKRSDNLTAEVVLRTLGQYKRPKGITREDGLAVLREVIDRNFPYQAGQWHMAEGRGILKETRVSAMLLVRLLARVQEEPAIRADFTAALSAARIDGTLRFRGFPHSMTGRIIGKSGTLFGVSNLSGYLIVPGDVVVFSFLVHHPGRKPAPLKKAMDRVMVSLYRLLLKQRGEKAK